MLNNIEIIMTIDPLEIFEVINLDEEKETKLIPEELRQTWLVPLMQKYWLSLTLIKDIDIFKNVITNL